MSVIAIKPTNTSKNSQTHIVPCLIHPTKSSFISYKDTQQYGPLKQDEWYFHGRRLVPTQLQIPQDYQACILKETDNSQQQEEDEDNKAWSVDTNLTSITLWNHESCATTDNAFLQLVNDWIPLANSIHMYPPS